MYQEDFKEFIKSRPDYKEGESSITQWNDFNNISPQTFPSEGESLSLSNSMVELRVVYFIQLVNVGYGNAEAAKNTQEFRSEHFDSILSKVFRTPDKREEFENLLSQLKSARDGMIGHPDADALRIKQRGSITTVGGAQNILRNADINYWHSFLEPLGKEILKYKNGL